MPVHPGNVRVSILAWSADGHLICGTPEDGVLVSKSGAWSTLPGSHHREVFGCCVLPDGNVLPLPPLPVLLGAFSWIDLRTDDGFDRLRWGITGDYIGRLR